jgi:tetratricopeptide (TPR) repeat protein
MAKWVPFPHAGEFNYTTASLKKQWTRLHAGDCEPLPQSAAQWEAWVAFHNGDFHKAVEVGLKAGGGGVNAANKATAIYATYLESKEKNRLDLFLEVAERAALLQREHPSQPNAWYWEAYALGRYSQGISVTRALAEGLGTRVRKALETTIKLAPRHADAHIALAAFHAEVIDKVGALIGGMTYGARKDVGLRLYRTALNLNPHSAIAMMEYANGLVILEGDKRMAEATKLYEEAALCEPADAMERLDVEMAKAELLEGSNSSLEVYP